MSNTWKDAADWLRNNYQDHANVASLCDAMELAAPSGNSSAAPSDDSQVLNDLADMVSSAILNGENAAWALNVEARLRAALAAPAPTVESRDKARIDWLIKNSNWSIRWRFNAKKKAEQWQMVDDGESWGQWGEYRAVIDSAMLVAAAKESA